MQAIARAFVLFWCALAVAGAAGCVRPVPKMPVEPDEPANEAEPTAEMTGEQWQSPGVPPPRDPALPWFRSYPLDDAWRELSAPYNHNAALVIFKRAELERGYFAGTVLISEDELARARGRLLKVGKVAPLDDPGAAREMPRMPDGRAYPAMVVQVGSREALREILELDTVEAVEPLFLPFGFGCALDAYTPIAADGDIFGNRIPWSFSHLGIVEAWNLYKNENDAIYFPGAGIRIGVVDTGVFETEDQLTTGFGSIVQPPPLHHTVVAKIWDDCGHGTRIAGLATAPLETQSIKPRKIAGVAWGADLTTVKYNSGVILGAGQVPELVAAIDLAVADGARVVNLALGTPFASNFVYDNIDRIYRNTQTIFVAAAGTFVKDVQFPASMYPQVLAVAIVKSRDKANPQAGYELYGGGLPESAYGPLVAFAAVNGDGGVPTTGGGQNLVQLGGSSSGTAHLSGIIALAWGKDPNVTREKVIERLKKSGSLKLISGEQDLVPGNSAKVGYGIPDAYVAAGGSRTASIIGPSVVLPGTSYTLTVSTDGWLPTTVRWNTGEYGRSATFTAGPAGSVIHSVTVTNPIDRKTVGAQREVTVGPTHKRVLYSEPAIVRYPPSWFKGGVYDVKVNTGVVMPAGCAVLNVLGQRLDSSYNNWGPPLSYLSLVTHGYTITRPGGVAARNLDADARVWHNGTHAIRVKVHYAIAEPDGVDCNVPGATVHGWYPGPL